MKTFRSILYSICLLPSLAYGHLVKDMVLPVVSVKDGDTIETRLTLPEPLNAFSVRIKGIDTPEKPADSYLITGKLGIAGCKKEAELAIKARTRLEEMVAQAKYSIIIRNFEFDKYGGRIAADVYLLINGSLVNVAEQLIKEGYGVVYGGDKKTHNWCE